VLLGQGLLEGVGDGHSALHLCSLFPFSDLAQVNKVICKIFPDTCLNMTFDINLLVRYESLYAKRGARPPEEAKSAPERHTAPN